ncbi:MAG: HPF/RaiA family ribosome-associated protein [Deltaproteobacteria bacterium]|nr:HPF/RaiA family ribosome-associated protein [Deltaproteobacteria bacterium]
MKNTRHRPGEPFRERSASVNIPLEITFRNVEKTEYLENLIREKADKLDQRAEKLSRVRVKVEKPNEFLESGNPYRVVIEMRMPPERDMIVRREVGEGDMHDAVDVVIRDAFEAALRRLEKAARKVRGDVKTHPEQQTTAVVMRVFKDQGYGFLRTVDNREIFFHENAVLNGDFDRLEAGTGVHFAEEMGENGPQATSVRITGKSGAGSLRAGPWGVEIHPGYEE